MILRQQGQISVSDLGLVWSCMPGTVALPCISAACQSGFNFDNDISIVFLNVQIKNVQFVLNSEGPSFLHKKPVYMPKAYQAA